MKRFKKVLSLVMIAAVILGMSVSPVLAAATPVIAIDGSPVTIEANLGTPFIDSANRTQAPIRAFATALGVEDSEVTWDQATQTATIDGTIKITMGSDTIKTAYGTIKMDTAAVNKEGRIYVPARYVANALGYEIEGTSANGVITANVITKVDLTMNAAVSLKASLDEIVKLYNAEKPNVKMTMNYDASGTLLKQIEAGAPVDMFFSADAATMNKGKDAGLMLNDTIKNMVQNKLVLAAPADSKLKIESFEDLKNADVKKIGVGEPTVVPAGTYADQVITYYNLKDALKDKLVFGKNVAEVRTWIESGNVDVGAIYATDAKIAGDKVKVVATAAAGHDPIVYPASIVKATKTPVAAQDFLNFLSTDAAKAVFVKYGFSTM